MSTTDRHGDERGMVLLFTALMMVGLLTVTAFVTDFGLMRVMHRSNQNLTDLAALAAGTALADPNGPDGQTACQDAVRYLRLNADELASLSLACNTLPAACTSSTAPVTVTQSAGSYRVEITYPVSDAMVADSSVPGSLRIADGEPCERMKVDVRRTKDAIFAGIVGYDDLTATASSVVRREGADARRVPSLWLLEPRECNALTVQGGSQVTVGTATLSGVISLDSDGSSCSGSSYVIDVGGSGSRLQAVPPGLEPPAVISLVAMHPGQTTCSTGNLRACDPSDIANGTLDPQPKRRPDRATRAPVDHAYDCKPSYPDYLGVPIQGCGDPGRDYITQLRNAVGTTGTPTGFQVWPSSNCNVPSGTTVVTGSWVVPCNTFRIANGTDVVFAGGNVIFNGGIAMTGGSLTFNSANPTANLATACQEIVTGCLTASSAGASWVYMRNGDLRMNGGALVARRTMIYQHSGDFTINGGSPPVWLAPTEGPFAGLAVWSEKSAAYQINGGASMELEGVFFIPYANAFTLSGGAPFIPQKAQFIARRAAISGGAVLTLSPNFTHAITIPAPPVSLIR
jgi:hypothetical protein